MWAAEDFDSKKEKDLTSWRGERDPVDGAAEATVVLLLCRS